MKVLISGATGLVGSELVSQCHAKGYGVNYLTTNKKKIISENNYHGFYWDPSKNEIDLDCLKDVSVVINLAGSSISKRWTVSYKKDVLDSRINSLRTLHSAISKSSTHQIESFISASAIGIYPNSSSNYYTEDTKGVDDSFLGDVVSKWEKEIDTFKSLNLKVAKVRIGLVMSANGGALPEMEKPIKYFVGAAFGTGEQWQSWIHIADLAGIFLFIAENKLKGTYNGVAPNPISNSKLIKEIAKTLQRPLFLPNIPEFVMRAILGEMSYVLFASQRVGSKKIEEKGYNFAFRNICSALQEIYKRNGVCATEEIDVEKEYVS